MRGYFFYHASNNKEEITRQKAAVIAADDGVKDVEQYLDEIEAGQHGLGDVQFVRNVSYGEIDQLDG